jgi:branched-chain amino acid transport system ATP-binding protein
MIGAMLTVTNLDLRYGDARALDGVSFNVARGSTTAIVGANGAGKTTLIRAIAGLLKPAAGSIRFKNREIAGAPSPVVCELGIGHVAEGRHIFPSMSVRENLEMGAMLKRARAGAAARMTGVLALFPRLAERLDQDAGTLSGGEQQMLAIGRCLMADPELILFDEPTQGLAPALCRELFRLIGTLSAEGHTIILVEQNVAASLRLADAAHVLENGRLVLSGSGLGLLENPRVREAYLGL